MLAKKFKDHKNKVTYPCFVQPKLDGFRMMKESDGEVAWTRGGKEHVQECVGHLMWDTDHDMVDGELILPGNLPLQATSRAAKKFKPGLSETLLYCVYDIVDPRLPFDYRYSLLEEHFKNAPENVFLVPCTKVNNEDNCLKPILDTFRKGMRERSFVVGTVDMISVTDRTVC